MKGLPPVPLGLRMPAEWEPHEATWIAWPQERTDWPGKLRVVQWVYGEIVRKIAVGEKVCILVGSREVREQAQRILTAARADLKQVEFFLCRTDRCWLRDSGPIFVRRLFSAQGSRSGQTSPPASLVPGQPRPQDIGPGEDGTVETDLAIVQFHFNGWAKYANWRRDRQVPAWAARKLGLPLIEARIGQRPFVLEGGGMDVNGRGTLLTTEECYLDYQIQVRNPGLDREGFEKAVQKYLGTTHLIWLGRGIAGDDTHGHVDDVCRFVNPTTVVLAQCDNPKDENYRPLAENAERLEDARLEDGSKLEVVRVPMPEPLYFRHERLPASYANFYIANAAVLVPTFNDPADRKALGLLADLFPDRTVLGIHAVDLVLGLGTIHCLTQQQPVGRVSQADSTHLAKAHSEKEPIFNFPNLSS